MNEWHPVETPPEEGAECLVYGPGGYCVATWTKWKQPQHVQGKTHGWDDGEYTQYPTHWMPLPESPKS